MNRKKSRERDRGAISIAPMISRAEDTSAAFSLPRPSKTLTALTTSALALPGIVTPARADAPIERATASSAFSYYFEDDLSPNDFDSGSRQRYEVFTEQLRFDFPVSDRFDLGVDFLYEEMSGASPWYVRPGPTGEALQVMSGATIEDTRIDGALDLDYYLDNGKDTVSAGFSTEKDYLSFHGGIGAERHFNDKNTTLNVAGSFAYNFIDPTDPEFSSARPSSGENWGIDLFAGLAQIITRASTAQITVNYKHSDGYLSDPYKAITDITQAGVLSDERPDTKNQVSLLARYRYHFEPVNGSAHLDYRLYADDWGVVSHTIEAAWYQNLFEVLTISPSLRWYTQSKADFYEAILPVGTPPSLRSSDFRLSPYGAVSARLKLDLELVDLFEYNPPSWLESMGFSGSFDLLASLSYERYVSDGDFAATSVREADEAPGLVNFQVVAFTISGRF